MKKSIKVVAVDVAIGRPEYLVRGYPLGELDPSVQRLLEAEIDIDRVCSAIDRWASEEFARRLDEAMIAGLHQ